MSKLTKKDIVQKFISELDNEGEMFFSTENVEQDYQIINDTLKSQGYWSGTKYRFYFDEQFNINNAEERW